MGIFSSIGHAIKGVAGGILGIGASAVGGAISSGKQNKNEKQAREAQLEAARLAIDAQRQGFVDTTRLQQGRAQSGDVATAQMLQMLGLPIPESLTSGAAYESIFDGSGLSGGGGGVGGGQRSSSGDAQAYLSQNPDVAGEWSKVSNDPQALKFLSGQGYSPDQQGYAQFHFDRYGSTEGRTFGGGGGDAGGKGKYAIDVPAAGNNLTELIQSTPGYQFGMTEGVRARDSSAANRGMLLSGGALKRLEEFGQDYAAEEFGRYFNRLASVSGAGQTATGAISNQAGQTGAGIAGIQQNLGQGLATSFGNQTSTFGNALGAIGSGIVNYQGQKNQPVSIFGGS